MTNNFDATKKKSIIIAARANDNVCSRLIDGAVRAFTEAGIEANNQHVLRVAGALEIPLALKMAARSRQFDIFLVIGAVIKGQTDHYEHVSRMANDGVMSVALEYQLALANCILCAHNMEQALERAGGACGNLGFDYANAAVDLAACYASLADGMAERE